MKRTITTLAIACAAMAFLPQCSSHTTATAPPVDQTEVVIVRPSPRHVWVPGHYTATRRGYVWRRGFYRVPPRYRTAWVPGHWQQTRRGYRWIDGHWQ